MQTSRTEFRKIVDYFREYYQTVTKNKDYKVTMTDNKAKLVENFIISFKNHYNTNLLQDDILKKYFDYQFNYWYKKDAKYGKGTSIQLEWILGKQAIKRWIDVDKKHLSFIVRKNLKKHNDFSKIKLKKKSENLKVYTELNEFEENKKSKFLNKDIGLEYCLQNTNMYNHKSLNCVSCNFRNDCKQNLKVIYPIIFKIRGYE